LRLCPNLRREARSSSSQARQLPANILINKHLQSTGGDRLLALLVHIACPAGSVPALPGLQLVKLKNIVSQPGTVTAFIHRRSSTTKLAKFFPSATPMRIPVRLTRLGTERSTLCENTILEFGTPCEVLFTSSLPLEFADRLRLRNFDGTLDVEARVVALEYNGAQTAVAARFAKEVANWIVKP
jgi:hypothetical protein